jgi:uncharacterized protein YehS (DUF1456 family)
MNNHDLLCRLVTALPLGDDDLAALVQQAGLGEGLPAPGALLVPPEEPGHLACDDATLVALLDALIVLRRGPRDGPAPVGQDLSANLVLKKLRIALNLHDKQMLAIFELAGVHLSRNQLGAMFRAPSNKHFQECSEGQLVCFLSGLARSRNA